MKILALTLVSGLAGAPAASAACWQQCVLKNPVSRQCVKYTKVCNPGDDPLRTEEIRTAIRRKALVIAQTARANGVNRYRNWVIIVASGLAAWGASYGGHIGAAVSAGAGIPAAELACEMVGLKP